jgi:outer membrane protein assembly factor BamD
MLRNHPGRIALAMLSIMILCACGGNKLKTGLTTEERLARAEKLFADGDYLDAQTELRIIILNAPGSSVVDRAQFLLAECHYKVKEYLLAAAEYEKLVRLYTRSEFLDDAQFKIGLSYFELSPKSDLDQKYTLMAINEFQKFLEDYPDSPLVSEVAPKLDLAREKLARKEYNTATLYRRMTYYDSAVISYDAVLGTYYDTRFAEPALFYKADCLLKMQKPAEAATSLRILLDKYPKTEFRSRAEEVLKNVTAPPATNGGSKP